VLSAGSRPSHIQALVELLAVPVTSAVPVTAALRVMAVSTVTFAVHLAPVMGAATAAFAVSLAAMVEFVPADSSCRP
jgi:hypothetical protein